MLTPGPKTSIIFIIMGTTYFTDTCIIIPPPLPRKKSYRFHLFLYHVKHFTKELHSIENSAHHLKHKLTFGQYLMNYVAETLTRPSKIEIIFLILCELSCQINLTLQFIHKQFSPFLYESCNQKLHSVKNSAH